MADLLKSVVKTKFNLFLRIPKEYPYIPPMYYLLKLYFVSSVRS